MLVGALAAVALIAAPSGFTENTTLNARAAYIAGKPVSVFCANDRVSWRDFVTSTGDTVTDPHGVTLTAGASETYLDPETCIAIQLRLGREIVSLPVLGAALLVLTHEAEHMRGSSDEGVTECAALRALPGFLVAKWGFRTGRPAYKQIMAGARSFHERAASQYRTVC